MHEAHMAHGSVMTWKEILLHIGIITVGLLIALGLDQIAEYFHHRHQLNEARVQIEKEIRIDAVQYKYNIEFLNNAVPVYLNDLQLIQFLLKHPGAPRTQWPHPFHLATLCDFTFDEFAWNNFKQSETFQYMPYEEQYRDGILYTYMSFANQSINECLNESHHLESQAFTESDLSRLTPTQLQALSDSIVHILQQAREFYRWFGYLNTASSQFPPVPAFPAANLDWGDFQITPQDKAHLDYLEKQYEDKVNKEQLQH